MVSPSVQRVWLVVASGLRVFTARSLLAGDAMVGPYSSNSSPVKLFSPKAAIYSFSVVME